MNNDTDQIRGDMIYIIDTTNSTGLKELNTLTNRIAKDQGFSVQEMHLFVEPANKDDILSTGFTIIDLPGEDGNVSYLPEKYIQEEFIYRGAHILVYVGADRTIADRGARESIDIIFQVLGPERIRRKDIILLIVFNKLPPDNTDSFDAFEKVINDRLKSNGIDKSW